MKIHESGVLPESNAYFHTPSLSAQQLFFTLSSTGRFVCSGDYFVSRPSYDSFLLLYVVHGEGYCMLGGERRLLSAGMIVLLDCYHAHSYGTDSGWEILWLHFDGRLARDYFDYIAKAQRQILLPRSIYRAARSFDTVYSMFHVDKRVSEALISRSIVSILTEFLLDDSPSQRMPEHTLRIEELLAFINENIEKPLTLELLARRASLSPFYFSRVFKRETGYTLREYLVSTRMAAARYYLRTTDSSLREIAARCGYSSDSTFCTTFRRVTGMTPNEYREKR